MQEEMTIEKTEQFFLNGEIRSAGTMAGVILERSVQNLCALHQISLFHSRKTRNLLDQLRDASVISREKHRELQHLVSIRNKCAHANPVTKEEVQKLIQRTKAFMRWVESQSSTTSASPASARPFVTQSPPIRKQLMCPVCGNNNRVRKVSGMTRNYLLEFPVSPSRSKWGRMSKGERYCYVLGWLTMFLGSVILCPLNIWPLVFGTLIVGFFMILVPWGMAAETLKQDRSKALEIWSTLYYCERDDALYSSERPKYYVSARNMREMLEY